MSVNLGVGNETVELAWLVSALGEARKQGQTKLVGYLEAVMDDMVFETESACLRLQPPRVRARVQEDSRSEPLLGFWFGRG